MTKHQIAPRAAIYARYSTTLQNARSVEDQFSLCEQHASRAGYRVVARHSDHARTGASTAGRPGLAQAMTAAAAGAFDVLVVEALDRLSRDQEDLAGIYKRLTFAGVAIEAVHDGTADAVQIGVRGMLGSLYLADLAHKVRRGMEGSVRAGRNPGGQAYGYRPRPGAPGELDIVESEAEVVRRIFRAYVDGEPPRAIAGKLNGEGIPAPRGGHWNASTINGNGRRGHGILRNPLYAGRLIWNRVRMVRHPETGRRISRANPPEEWIERPAPELAIVPPDLWERAQRRKADLSKAWVNRSHMPRRPHLLSGLLRCAHCGGGMSLDGRRAGDRHIRCSRARESGTCDHARRVSLCKVEATVLGGLRAELERPDALALYLSEYRAEMRRLTADVGRRRAGIERRLADIDAQIRRLTAAYAAGRLDIDAADDMSRDLANERDALRADLAAAAAASKITDLRPEAVAIYRDAVARLHIAEPELSEHNPDLRAALRDLIEQVDVITGGDLAVRVHGRLGALAGHGGTGMVAEARFEGCPPAPGVIAFPIWRAA